MFDSTRRETHWRHLFGAFVCVVLLIAEFIALQAFGVAVDASLEPAPAWTPWFLIVAGVVGGVITTMFVIFVVKALASGKPLTRRQK